jgi:ATP-dependent DNA ligase
LRLRIVDASRFNADTIMLQRVLPAGFIAPCLPTKATTLPSGALWLHEVKHDGFRVIARKDGDRIRLYSRPGNDLTSRFPCHSACNFDPLSRGIGVQN